jgi:membrane protein YqaA with SNARE-associated domain
MMELGIVLGAAMTCALGGVFPWINSEVVILGTALLVPPTTLPLLVAACAVGQMSTKAGVYAVTRWAPHVLPERARKLLAGAERYRDRRGVLVGAVFLGSSVSVPPFYLVTLASGLLRVPFAVFCLVGLLGTATRYAVLVTAACAFGMGECP